MRSAQPPLPAARPHCALVPALLGVLATSFPASLSAATLPAGFTETNLTGNIASPTAMAIAPDGRLFVCLQGGHCE